jgi:carboxyl-terminal processing protease
MGAEIGSGSRPEGRRRLIGPIWPQDGRGGDLQMLRRTYFAFAMIGSVGFFGWQASSDAKPRDEMLELYGLFVDAVEKVETNYVRPVSRRELLESALEGMLQNLDPHSSYINTGEWRQFRRQIEGKFGGIGIQVGLDQESGRLRVIAPMVGTPAYEAGILAGDQIVEIDGQSAEGMSPDKAAEVLQGSPGTEVKLSVLHEGSEDPEQVSMSRAIIEVPTVLADRRKPDDQWDFMLDKDKKIGYVRIATFSQNTPDELKKALDQLKEEGAKGLIIDLRDDPGGLLSSAVAICDMFLDKGEIVSTKGRNTPARRYYAEKNGQYEDLPMVVLINQYSASASEILSAALQDHKRAVIVGQRSYGKGSVQNIIDLDGGKSVLKLTVASYYRPSGENIHRFKNAKTSDKWGVSPDKGAEVKLANSEFVRWFDGRRDRDQEAAAKGHRKTPASVFKSGKTKPAPDEKTQQKAEAKTDDKKTPEKGAAKSKTPHDPAQPFVDKQLDKAMEILRGKLANG